MKYSTNGTHLFGAILMVTSLIIFPCVATAQDAKQVIVNVDNFVRAETASQTDRGVKMFGLEVNKWVHFRTPIPLEKQSVIRMNRDTIYSTALNSSREKK